MLKDYFSVVNKNNFDILILGGGVIGLSCAHYLLKAGRSVAILDQSKTGRGASHGNCGTITPSHAPPLAMPGVLWPALKNLLHSDAPFYIKPQINLELFQWLIRFWLRCRWKDFYKISKIKAKLLCESRDLLAELISANKIECQFEKKGTLYVFRDPKYFEQSQWLPDILKKCGIAIATLDGAAARVMEPTLNDSVVAGYFNPGDVHLRPDRYMVELAKLVSSQGGKIYENTKVADFHFCNDRIDKVITQQGEFSGREILLALGAWSPQFNKKLGLSLPIQPGKGYSITFERPQQCPTIPLVLKERSVCVTNWSSGFRLGSTMEFAGYDDSLNRCRLDALTRAASEYLKLPIEDFHKTEEWYGWRPMTYDDLPVIGRASHLSNLILATGHGMLGMSLSAITGLLISELLNNQPNSVDISPFSPSRFL